MRAAFCTEKWPSALAKIAQPVRARPATWLAAGQQEACRLDWVPPVVKMPSARPS